MELVRIGEKLISVTKIHKVVEDILTFRSQGVSQAEAASRYGVDRTFVSRLESIGELRKGRSIAVIGFPVANKWAVLNLCQEMGVDFSWVMTDQERRDYAQSVNGIQLVNEILNMAGKLRQYDVVVLLASNARVRLLEALLHGQSVIPVILGPTPLEYDVEVDISLLEQLIRGIQVRDAGDGS